MPAKKPKNPTTQSDGVMTTTQCAKVLGMATKTIADLIDDGQMGWRIPGSTHRRVRRSELVAFAERHGITLPSDFAHVTAKVKS